MMSVVISYALGGGTCEVTIGNQRPRIIDLMVFKRHVSALPVRGKVARSRPPPAGDAMRDAPWRALSSEGDEPCF